MSDAIISFFAAILAGMGVGSGGIMVVWFALAVGLPQLDAQLLNLIFFAASSVAALTVNAVKKRLSLSVILPTALGGCLFSAGAALIAGQIDSSALRRWFGGLLIIMSALSAFFTLKAAKKDKKD